MKNSYNIWVPSLQTFLRFKELDFDQYRCLLKVLEDKDIEFIYQLNDIMKENLISEFDIKKLTTLDRFAIFLALKIHSCGPTITLSKKCEKCEKSVGIKMDLNQLIVNIAPKIDRKFTKRIAYNNFVAICDIPTIETEYQIYLWHDIFNADTRSIEFTLTNYILSHIAELIIDGKVINFENRTYAHRLQILNKLPAGLAHSIEKHFLNEIHSSVTDIDFLKITCDKCKEEFEMKFDVININDILKIVYKDNNVESILHTLMNISIVSNGISDTIMRLSPSEVDILHNIAKEANKSSQPSPNDGNPPPERNLFEEYRQQTEGMAESPSEFSL